MSLIDKLLKNSTIKETAILNDSKIFNKRDTITTSVPMINVALSGSIDGGLTSGLHMIAGPSKHFKTAFALLLANSFMKKYPEGVILFYDSEFGTPLSYFDSFDIDKTKTVHTPIMNVEELKFDVSTQLDGLEKTDKVLIIIDSIGNLASKKEVDDALEGKSVADMSRAKQLKSTFRIITPHLTMKDIPMVVVNHTYKEMSLFPRDVVSGGCLQEGTLIRLADGNMQPVEKFVIGDIVSTMNGPKEVTAVWNPDTLDEGTPECYEISFEDGNTYVVSDRHKFLINGVWIEAKNLKEMDECTII